MIKKHLSGESLGRFPVWMMRQAGRYLPSYREVRKQYGFWEMATKPEIAAKVSLLPLEVIDVDAVIFFSDILTLPYGQGVPVEMKESVGPVIHQPLRKVSDFDLFLQYEPKKHTGFVGEALGIIKKKMPSHLTLLGFAGAPWTVASYLIEGKATRQFEAVKTWAHRDPEGLTAALERYATATIAYLKYQAESGADMVQLFDTWLCEMPRPFFLKAYLPMLNRIVTELKSARIPVIYYTKNAHHVMGDLQSLPLDVLSVDSLLTLTDAEARTGGKFSLQGNLDPILLLGGDVATVRKHTRLLVNEARKLKKPPILNLGHGVLPLTPVENVKAFVEEARALWI